jgi:hypothetical protein
MARNRLIVNAPNLPRRPVENSIISYNNKVSNFIAAEAAYKNRPILRERAVIDFNSDITWTNTHISNVLKNAHAGRLFNVLPLHILYPDLILEKFYWAAIFGLWTSAKDISSLPAQNRNSPLLATDQLIKINLSLPDTDQRININVILVDDLEQILLNNGAQYLNLQERIGKNFYKLPSQMLAEDGVLPVRTLLPTIQKNHIWVKHQFFPVKFLYNENFYIEAHQAGLYSGTQATAFCYNYLGLDYKSSVSKYDNVLSGAGEDFLHKDKIENRKFTDIHLHPSKTDTE